MTSHAETAATGPGILDTASLLAEVADGMVVASLRDTHLALLHRTHRVLGPRTGSREKAHHAVHLGVASTAYAGAGVGLKGARWALDRLAAVPAVHRRERRLESGPRGRFVRSAVNGLIGDRLAEERPAWALEMSVRRGGRDVSLDRDSLAAAYPDATRRIAVFVHGLCENESYWDWRTATRGPGYPHTVAELGWTPVLIRANTGLELRRNGASLAALLQHLVSGWPHPVEQITLVGHSMGGLILRAASAVRAAADAPWVHKVSDVVTLGTPHLGAPLAHGIGTGAERLVRVPETAALGRFLDWRSVGVRDLVDGLADDVPALPRARYRLVSATVTASARNPVGRWLGDAMVRQHSAYGTRGSTELFPGADVLHLPRTDHINILNHARVHHALREWLA